MKLGVFTPVFGKLAFPEMLDGRRRPAARERPRTGHRRLAGARSHRPRRACWRARATPTTYRQRIADAGLTISALSCHGNPLHPDAARAERRRRDVPADGAAGRTARGAGGRHLLGLPGRRPRGAASQLGDHAMAAGVPRRARLAVGGARHPVLDRTPPPSPPTTASRWRSSRIRASWSTTSRRRCGCAPPPDRTSASTSIRATSSGRAWTRP